MNIFQRYRRLSIWNRLGACGSIASIASIPLAIVLTVVSIWITFRLSNSPANINTNEDMMQSQQNTSKQETKRPIKRKAPKIVFQDGKKAVVKFALTDHIEEEDATVVVVKCGTAEKARETVEAKVLSSLIAELETKTLTEVRQSRSEIEQVLVKKLAPLFKNVGLTIDHFSLLEFDEIN